MYNKQFKKIALLLMIGSFASVVSAQTTVLKLGNNPYTINATAALEVESTTKGFLPPRMTKQQRDAITSPPAGLQLWCIDCKDTSRTVVGQLCAYTGTSWIALPTMTIPIVTTTSVVKSSGNTVATITGVLKDVFGNSILESGVVYKVYTSDADLPTLVATSGVATLPNKKSNNSGALPNISVTVSSLTASTIYYWRTFVRTADGIGYGDAMKL